MRLLYPFVIPLCLLGLLLAAGCDDLPVVGGDDTPPSAPIELSTLSGDQFVELSWSANDEDDLAGYNLYRSEESFEEVSQMNPINDDELITETHYTDSGRQNGTPYYYRLTAVDESNNESDVSSLQEVTPFADPPDRPDGD